MIVANGDSHNLTTQHWKLTSNDSVDDNNYRHVELRHADDATAAFDSYPIQPDPFPSSTLNNLQVLEKNGGGDLWAIHKSGNGQMRTFFKKAGVVGHWAHAEVSSALNSYNQRIQKKLQNGYTPVTKNAYWDADNRTVCYANGTEI